MIDRPVGRVALFSIHPDYANALLGGTKKVEFRRRGLSADVTRVVIYATSPAQQVIGFFEVAGVEQLAPSAAWERFGGVGGIEKGAFDRYYRGSDSAFVIRAKDPVRLPSPVQLATLDEGLRPPQSFVYLSRDAQSRLMAQSKSHRSRKG